LVQKFAAVRGIIKVQLGIAKCTGSIGEHVGEFASMKNEHLAASTSCIQNQLAT